MDSTKPGLIFESITAVMTDIDSVAKSRSNQQQGYSFRGIDDMYNALHGPLAKHGVFPAPEVLEHTTVERSTRSGGTMAQTVLKARIRFYARDGSYIDVVTLGEAMDAGDKSCNKAMSAAMKYALIQTFCIPTAGDNDTENSTPELGAKSPPPTAGATQAPARTASSPAAAPPLPQAATPGKHSMVIDVADVQTFNGTSRNTGKPFTKYNIIDTAGNKFSTFDEKLANVARSTIGTGTKIEVAFVTGRFGNDIAPDGIAVCQNKPEPPVDPAAGNRYELELDTGIESVTAFNYATPEGGKKIGWTVTMVDGKQFQCIDQSLIGKLMTICENKARVTLHYEMVGDQAQIRLAEEIPF